MTQMLNWFIRLFESTWEFFAAPIEDQHLLRGGIAWIGVIVIIIAILYIADCGNTVAYNKREALKEIVTVKKKEELEKKDAEKALQVVTAEEHEKYLAEAKEAKITGSLGGLTILAVGITLILLKGTVIQIVGVTCLGVIIVAAFVGAYWVLRFILKFIIPGFPGYFK